MKWEGRRGRGRRGRRGRGREKGRGKWIRKRFTSHEKKKKQLYWIKWLTYYIKTFSADYYKRCFNFRVAEVDQAMGTIIEKRWRRNSIKY